MAGPTTRDRFMFTELSDTAPLRSRSSTSSGMTEL